MCWTWECFDWSLVFVNLRKHGLCIRTLNYIFAPQRISTSWNSRPFISDSLSNVKSQEGVILLRIQSSITKTKHDILLIHLVICRACAISRKEKTIGSLHYIEAMYERYFLYYIKTLQLAFLCQSTTGLQTNWLRIQ